MTDRRRGAEAAEIMLLFADETGLSSDRAPRRYLWTDAFAVCNFLELHEETGERRFLDLAVRLVRQVHEVLGRHREDDPRTGWLSGLSGEEAERHPTLGGLRIGKPLPERTPHESPDDPVEWDRDGQYYHYLTKWLHALSRTGQVTGNADYVRWAFELAKTMHARFVHPSPGGGGPYLVWKMSIDLTRPLVASMGQHDPLDGLITYAELEAGAPEAPAWADLHGEIAELTRMCERGRWATADPLGAGSLLADTYRVAQLMTRGQRRAALFETLLRDSASSVVATRATRFFDGPAERRLAFRELGLAIGLRAIGSLSELVSSTAEFTRWRPAVEDLRHHQPLADDLVAYWRVPHHRRATSWTDHVDINRVMLATSLAPEAFLGIG